MQVRILSRKYSSSGNPQARLCSMRMRLLRASTKPQVTSLQFGRDCEVAEILRSQSRQHPRQPRFNSAATVRSRKSGTRVPQLCSGRWLQFGRDCEVAEMGKEDQGIGEEAKGFNSAATVRSRKFANVCRFPCRRFTLQFGRDCEVAEILQAPKGRSSATGLQFGRDCEVAEISSSRSSSRSLP